MQSLMHSMQSLDFNKEGLALQSRQLGFCFKTLSVDNGKQSASITSYRTKNLKR
jgi:hypothetical protein